MASAANPVPSPVLALPNYGPIVSAQLIGTVLQFSLAGMLLVQVCIYSICFPQDPRAVKAIVYLVSFLMLLRTVLVGAEAEFWFASGFGDIMRFVHPHDLRVYTPCIGPIIAFIVELFFCYRIVVLRGSAWPIAAFTLLVSAVQCACGIASGILYYTGGDALYSPHHVAHTVVARVWLFSGVAAAVLISASITFILLTAKVSQTTHYMLKNAAWLTIETNGIAALIRIVAVSLQFGFPGTTYWICPAMLLPGIYTNTILATLNHRAIARLRLRLQENRPAADQDCDATLVATSRPTLTPKIVLPESPSSRMDGRLKLARRQPSEMSMRLAAAIGLPRLEVGAGLGSMWEWEDELDGPGSGDGSEGGSGMEMIVEGRDGGAESAV